MNIVQLRIGKCDYNRSTEFSVCLFGIEVYVSKTRMGVWTVGCYVDWRGYSWSKTFW